MKISKGVITDINELESLYNDLNDYLDIHTNFPGWKKGHRKKPYGFYYRTQYIDTVDLGYGEYGLDAFELYQKLL